MQRVRKDHHANGPNVQILLYPLLYPVPSPSADLASLLGHLSNTAIVTSLQVWFPLAYGSRYENAL